MNSPSEVTITHFLFQASRGSIIQLDGGEEKSETLDHEMWSVASHGRERVVLHGIRKVGGQFKLVIVDRYSRRTGGYSQGTIYSTVAGKNPKEDLMLAIARAAKIQFATTNIAVTEDFESLVPDSFEEV